MVIGGSAALFLELEAAVSGGSSERRIDMLRQVTDLFLSDVDRLDANQITVFDDVLVQLIDASKHGPWRSLVRGLRMRRLVPHNR